MKTDAERAHDSLAKYALKDIVRKCLDNLSRTQTEFEIDVDRRVISIKDFTGTTGSLIMIQSLLAVKISEWYREQRMEHVHWKLECADTDEDYCESDETDLTDLGMQKAADEEGWRDR